MARNPRTPPSERVGIADLIVLQFERCSFSWIGLLTADDAAEGILPRVAPHFRVDVMRFLEPLRCGDYRAVEKIRDSFEELVRVLPNWLERNWDTVREVSENVARSWEPFVETCELAERIDAFLASLSTGTTAAAFARGCRDDLTTLLVLADWCDEHNLPHAASEARHLHDLTRYLLR